MRKMYRKTENGFEKLTSIATTILGNSITFILAFCLVLFWWINSLCHHPSVHEIIGDIIFGSTFLSLFIIQKAFNRFSALLHLKVNELVVSNENASNAVINAEIKTELEIMELSKEYSDLAEQILEDESNNDPEKEV